MKASRLILAVPLLAGLAVTGSAVARMMPAETSVRDSVYQTCAHNGVHFNKQGHANCGLHLGWSTSEPGQETAVGGHGKGHLKPNHPTHPSKPDHSGKTHGNTTHGKSGHSHG